MPDKVKFGVKNLHYAVLTETESGGVISYSYATPVPIKGAVSLTLDPQANNTPWYADDKKYFSVYKNNGYTGTVEVAYFPESMFTDVWGDVVEATDKVLVEKDVRTVKRVALLFEEEGDATGTKFVLYDVDLARPSRNLATTNDTVTPQTQSVAFTANVRDDDVVMATTTPDTPSAVLSAWYTSVWEA